MVEEWCFLVHGEGQKKSNEQVLVLMQLVDCRNGYTTDGSASTIWRALHSEAPQAQSEPPPAINYPTPMEGTKNGQCCHYFQEEKKLHFPFLLDLILETVYTQLVLSGWMHLGLLLSVQF